MRIAQLELLAALVAVKRWAPTLRDSFTRFHIDNLAAKFCLINCYSGNAFMARLASEIWAILLEYNVLPYFEYVPTKENVADIFSRPDLLHEGALLSKRFDWKPSNTLRTIPALRHSLTRSPKATWTTLWGRLYGGEDSVESSHN